MLKHLGPIVATALVILILLAAAMPLMHWYEMERRWAAFDSNRALWESHRITDYDFTIRMSCFCEPPAGVPIRVIVRRGRMIDAFDSRNPNAGAGVDMGDIPDTIMALFDELYSRIEAGPDAVEIDYDDEFGFPAAIMIDEFLDYDDDEVSYEISDFEAVDLGA